MPIFFGTAIAQQHLLAERDSLKLGFGVLALRPVRQTVAAKRQMRRLDADEPDEEEPEELDEVDGDAAGVEEVFEEELSFEDELEEPLTLDDEPERLSVR